MQAELLGPGRFGGHPGGFFAHKAQEVARQVLFRRDVLAQHKSVPLLEVLLFVVAQVDEVLHIVAVLEQEPGVLNWVLWDRGAGLELDFAEGVEEGLFSFGDEDCLAGALCGKFLSWKCVVSLE